MQVSEKLKAKMKSKLKQNNPNYKSLKKALIKIAPRNEEVEK